MDIITYAILNKKISTVNENIAELEEKVDNVTLAYTYRGSVDSYEELPDDAVKGDLYTVESTQYVFDGIDWVEISGKLATIAEVDALFD